MADINLSPYTAESAAIDRRRKMAEVLQAQSMQPLDSNQMAGGWVVPVSPYAGLAKMLQGYNAGSMNRQADQDMRDLYTKQQDDSRGDMSALVKALSGQAAQPERAPMMDPQESQQMADQGTPMAPNIPAVAARAPGVIDPSVMDSMKTPQGQQMAMAQILAQLAPKDGIVLPEGASLVSKTGTVLRQGTPKQEFGTTPHYENVDGRMMAVVYDKQGNRKVIGPATPVNQFTTGTVDAGNKLQQAQFEFNNLSAQQRAQLENEGRRIGISGAELYFNTGMGAGNAGAALPRNGQMPNFGTPAVQNFGQPPAMPPQGMPPQAAPQMPPQMAPQRPAMQPQAMPPQAAPQSAPVVPGLTPKAQAGIAEDRAKQASANASDSNSILILAQGAETLLDKAHGSGVGNIIGGAQNFLGIDSTKNQADAQLTALSGALVSKQPKMSGPQSDKDVLLYKQMAGDIGNATLPASVRKAALQTVRRIAETYASGFSQTGYQSQSGASGSFAGPERRQSSGNVRVVDF